MTDTHAHSNGSIDPRSPTHAPSQATSQSSENQFLQDRASLSEAAASWLENNRKIPIEIAVRCGVVTVADSTGAGKLAFEYRRNGALQYRKIRIPQSDGSKRFMRDRKEVETGLFLEHMIQENPDLSSPLVICEGELDACALVAAAIGNVVSVPDGAQRHDIGTEQIVIPEDKAFAWLWDVDGLKPHIAQFKTFVLATDNDKPGRVLREELAVRLDRWKCLYVTYPEGCKDANDVLIQHGSEKLHEIIKSAKPLVPDRLVSFMDIYDDSYSDLLQSGFSDLDNGLGFNMVIPELAIVTGKPGSGKSELAVVLGANLARMYQLPGAVLQFEDRSARVQQTLLRYARHNVPGVNSTPECEAWVRRWFRTIAPMENLESDTDYTMEWIKGTLKEARVRHGCKWAILDPWNEVVHNIDRGQTETQYTNDALRMLKKLSRSLGMLLMVVVHPTKEGGREANIEDLDMYAINGGAAWYNKADHGLIVHRDDQSKPDCYVKLAKAKDHLVMGKPGIVRMRYDFARARYDQMGLGV